MKHVTVASVMVVVTLITISLLLGNVEGTLRQKYGCLLSPGICVPPENCCDDCLIGDCLMDYSSTKLKPEVNRIALVNMLNYLETKWLNYYPKRVRDDSQDVTWQNKKLYDLLRESQSSISNKKQVPREQYVNENSRQLRNTESEYFDPVLRGRLEAARHKKLVDLVTLVHEYFSSRNIEFSDLSPNDMTALIKILASILKNNNGRNYEINEDTILKTVDRGTKMDEPLDSDINSEPIMAAPKMIDNESDDKLIEQNSDIIDNSLDVNKDKVNEDNSKQMNNGPELSPSLRDQTTDELSDSQDKNEARNVMANEPMDSQLEVKEPYMKSKKVEEKKTLYIVVIVIVTATVLLVIVVTLVTCCLRVYRHRAEEKLVSGVASQPLDDDYQELCRQHYASKSSEQSDSYKNKTLSPTREPLLTQAQPVQKLNYVMSENTSAASTPGHNFPAESSATSSVRKSSESSISWSEEPITASLDISTGHAVLSYMEDHLCNRDRLNKEWEDICVYEAEGTKIYAATNPKNSRKNRTTAALPFDHNRVKLNVADNHVGSDYINASYIIDNDPKLPLYIAAQGPLSSTIPDYWQMVWEQGCVAIVMLTPLVEEGVNQCARYWPDEGSSSYHDFEIHLVSEHIWCEDYLVRSLYVKNLKNGDTRTVTQFHFLSWPNDSIPMSLKPLLELRRKVTKCYKGHNSPILVHCSDGVGRTGTYILLDLAINRMLKGAKEIDIAATLEHIRDQRTGMVRTKEQFEFALTAVADEVNAILKSLTH